MCRTLIDGPVRSAIAKVRQIDTTSSTPAAARRVTSPPARETRAAVLLLVLSVGARLAWTYLAPNGANFVDLHVYVSGAASLDHPGTLYGYVYADQTPDFPLPFTYPPFAAVVFYPLHLVPFGLIALLWQVVTMAALYGAVRISQRLMGGTAETGHFAAMLWTAIAIWIEPLRSTFDYGQINVLLMLAALWAVYTPRWWLSGLLVGVASGVKLRRRLPLSTSSAFGGCMRPHFRWSCSLPPSACRYWSSAMKPATTSPTCWATQAGLGPSPPPSINPGAARFPGFSVTTPVLVRWFWLRSPVRRYWPSWPGVRSTGPIGWANYWWSSCSACCSRRSPGLTTGCG